MRWNDFLAAMPREYLFASIARRVTEAKQENPDRVFYPLGIGDVTRPLAPTVAGALCAAAREMGESVHGYAPDGGMPALRAAIADVYAARGALAMPDEVFAGDGAKSDLFRLSLLFGDACCYLPDPGYPATADALRLSGKTVVYYPAEAPAADLRVRPHSVIVLNSPANPTGACRSRAALEEYVACARASESILLFDAAYEAFAPAGMPRSIYEIDGARACAIEVGSFSKSCGFTGLRCGYTVVPRDLAEAHALYARLHACTFNGTSYPAAMAALAALSARGRRECEAIVASYRAAATALASSLRAAGVVCSDGSASPYVWVTLPPATSSVGAFEKLLARGVITTPGIGFGSRGEGHLRLSAFAGEDVCRAALPHLTEVLTS